MKLKCMRMRVLKDEGNRCCKSILPLLDVALLLLGLLMIVMMQASLTDQESVNPEAEQSIESKAGMDFIFCMRAGKIRKQGNVF